MTARNHGADWIKWLAISTMVIDHLKWIDITSPWAALAELIGRFTFPLFALLLGWNFAFHSKNRENLCKRVLAAGILMWGIEATLLYPITRPETTNAFITLGIGCLLALAFTELKSPLLRRSPKNWLLLGLALGLSALGAFQSQYGLPGIVLTATCCLLPPNKSWKMLPILLLTLLCNPMPLYGPVGTLAIPLGVALLNLKNIPTCPLPNTKWLYLSLPLSYLPAWIYHTFAKIP